MWREGDVAVRSMTGFGASTFEAGGAAYACTIRSVNRKHVDVAVRLPVELAALEPAIRSRVQAVCSRGDVSVVLERDRSKGARRVDVDETDVAKLQVGSRAYFTAAAFGGQQFWGRVARIGSELGRKNVDTGLPAEKQDTKILETLVDLDGHPPLPPGLRVDSFIQIGGR